MNKHRLFAAAIVLLSIVSFALAGCSGGSDSAVDESASRTNQGSGSVPSSAVAVVGGKEVAMDDFRRLLRQTQATYRAQGRELPKPGSEAEQVLRVGLVQILVQRAQLEGKANELGIEVTDEHVDRRLGLLRKTRFGGSDERLQLALANEHLSLESLRADIRAQIVQERLYERITRSVKVSDREVRAYYKSHEAQHRTPESRFIRHIVVAQQSLARDLRARLDAGADFAKLAKHYSTDRASGAVGGAMTIVRGEGDRALETVVFNLETNDVSSAVHSKTGWQIVEALEDPSPAESLSLAQVESQIRQQVLDQQKSEKMSAWLEAVNRELRSSTSYQKGYLPPGQRATVRPSP